jgi:methylglutaconyl-CoA hydratase
MQHPYVTYTATNGIGTIEFFTPQHNSLPSSILQQLAVSIGKAANDETCKIIVLQSAGNKTFCAGASFTELLAIETEEQGLHFFSGFAHVINAMRTCPKFIIALVQGKAIGGGVGLACSADYCFATENADIKLSELAVGIGPFVVGPAVERKIGTSAAYELAIDATNFRNANWALQKGMYNAVFSSINEMHTHAMQLANTLANSSASAMAAIKEAFWKPYSNWDIELLQRAGISGKLVLTKEAKTFLEAFKTKGA